MDKEIILKILKDYKKGKIPEEKILERLKQLPYENIDFAKIDNHRNLRTGFSEVVYCEGKTIDQVISIFKAMKKMNNNIILTRANKTIYTRLKKLNLKISFYERSNVIVYSKFPQPKKGNVLVMAAGTSDLAVAEEAFVTAETMGCHVTRITDVGVAGLHRLLSYLNDIYNATCIIAVAGMDGAMVSVVGGLAKCPVIAVPTSVGYGTSFKGVAALLTMLNSCSPGVSVMNIDNGFGAGYFAALISANQSQ